MASLLQKEDIKKISKILLKAPYEPTLYKSYIFFPISREKLVEDDGLLFVSKDSNRGAAALVEPGLILDYVKIDEKSPVLKACIAYASTDYAYEFDILEHFALLGYDLSKSERMLLNDLKCLLVRKDAVLEAFEYKVK